MPGVLPVEVPAYRLYVMRGMYLLNFVLLGSDVWPRLLNPDALLAPTNGVAYSFWASLSLLSVLGLRYPLKMLPLFLMQLLYKALWLVAVALPLRSAGELGGGALEMTWVFVIGGILDLVVIPWPYVWARFVKEPGDGHAVARRGE